MAVRPAALPGNARHAWLGRGSEPSGVWSCPRCLSCEARCWQRDQPQKFEKLLGKVRWKRAKRLIRRSPSAVDREHARDCPVHARLRDSRGRNPFRFILSSPKVRRLDISVRARLSRSVVRCRAQSPGKRTCQPAGDRLRITFMEFLNFTTRSARLPCTQAVSVRPGLFRSTRDILHHRRATGMT